MLVIFIESLLLNVVLGIVVMKLYKSRKEVKADYDSLILDWGALIDDMNELTENWNELMRKHIKTEEALDYQDYVINEIIWSISWYTTSHNLNFDECLLFAVNSLRASNQDPDLTMEELASCNYDFRKALLYDKSEIRIEIDDE